MTEEAPQLAGVHTGAAGLFSCLYLLVFVTDIC